MPLKVYVDTGESVWSTNGLEFDTYENAKAYGGDLMSRWMAVRAFAVVPVPPNFIGYLTTAVIRKIEVKKGTITADDAGRMYPVWKWLDVSEEEFREEVRVKQDISSPYFTLCIVDGCERSVPGAENLCPPHMGAYHRKRAQVIRSMGA